MRRFSFSEFLAAAVLSFLPSIPVGVLPALAAPWGDFASTNLTNEPNRMAFPENVSVINAAVYDFTDAFLEQYTVLSTGFDSFWTDPKICNAPFILWRRRGFARSTTFEGNVFYKSGCLPVVINDDHQSSRDRSGWNKVLNGRELLRSASWLLKVNSDSPRDVRPFDFTTVGQLASVDLVNSPSENANDGGGDGGNRIAICLQDARSKDQKIRSAAVVLISWGALLAILIVWKKP